MKHPIDTLPIAVQLHKKGDLARAESIYRNLLSAQPQDPDLLYLLGLVTQDQNKHREAIDLFAQAISGKPASALFHLQRGLSFRAIGQLPEALEEFAKATALDPKSAEALHQTGNVFKHVGRYAEAAACLRQATALAPDQAAIWLNLGAACHELRLYDEAVSAFRRALKIEPNRPEAHNSLGNTLLSQGLLSQAQHAFCEALKINPQYAAAHDNLGRALRLRGRPEEALLHFRTALRFNPRPSTHSNLLYSLNFSDGIPPQDVFSEHRKWAKLYAHESALKPVLQPPGLRSYSRIRLGYVSADFNHHAVSYFFESVLETHDRAQFEVICYSNVRAVDHVTQRLKSKADLWRDICLLDDEKAVELIRSDNVDILVDLSGHTAHNRLLVFAKKPARIQVTWLGYPNTTGLKAIDYRLTDAVSDPLGQAENFYSEKLWRMPEVFSCYRPSEESPLVAPPPSLAIGYITFGSFNNFAKINRTLLSLWSDLLVRLPSSRLILKAHSLADPETATEVRAHFAAHHLDPSRIEFNSHHLSVAAQLDFYRKVDIALDSFPYNGTTTTCEALWMGVPLVTMAGKTHVSRVTASMLTHLGRASWIAQTPEAYIDRCLALASDFSALEKNRQEQRERMRASPICNAARFTAQLEEAYRQMLACSLSTKA